MLMRVALPLTVVLLTTTGIAQDRVRLQFEIVKNDTEVGRPQVTLADGGRGRIGLPEVAEISFDVARTAPDRVTVSFEITSGDKEISPRIVLVASEPGSVSWTAGQDSVQVRVWAR